MNLSIHPSPIDQTSVPQIASEQTGVCRAMSPRRDTGDTENWTPGGKLGVTRYNFTNGTLGPSWVPYQSGCRRRSVL